MYISLNYEFMWAHGSVIYGGPNLGSYVYIVISEKDAYEFKKKKKQKTSNHKIFLSQAHS